MLREAGELNPGPWTAHSVLVAQAAERIAAHLPGLDTEQRTSSACCMTWGAAGVTGNRHVYDGYRYLSDRGYEPAAAWR